MSPPSNERRPRATEGDESSGAANLKLSGDSTDPIDVVRLAQRHDYAVLVSAERVDGVVTQQVYTNLPAAERKLARNHERGLNATLCLVRLVPVGGAL